MVKTPTAVMLNLPVGGESSMKRAPRYGDRMHFTRPRELLAAALIGLVLAYLLFQVAYGSIPRLPTLAGVTLLALAVLELTLAFSVRNRIRAGRVVAALAIARAVALAK